MSKKHNKVSATLHYFEHYFILASVVTGRISISSLSSLLGISIGINSSAVGIKICATTAAIKNYKPIIKKKEKRHDKILLLAKSKLIVKQYRSLNF